MSAATPLPRAHRLLIAVAGGGDLLTGGLLLVAPATVLTLLGDPSHESLLMRWIGAFVAAVGGSYFLPLLGRAPRAGRLAGVLEATALVRAAVTLFLVVAVAAGQLPPSWRLVAGWDGAVAAWQVALLRRGGGAP